MPLKDLPAGEGSIGAATRQENSIPSEVPEGYRTTVASMKQQGI